MLKHLPDAGEEPMINKLRGFSLVELMVVIAVLAIILGIAVPSFVDVLRSNQVRAQANELVGLLTYARSEAIKRRTDVDVDFTVPSNWVAAVSADNTDLRVINGSNTNLTLGATKVTFDLRGRRKVGPVCLQLDHKSSNSHTRNIVIGIGGAFQVAQGACT